MMRLALEEPAPFYRCFLPEDRGTPSPPLPVLVGPVSLRPLFSLGRTSAALPLFALSAPLSIARWMYRLFYKPVPLSCVRFPSDALVEPFQAKPFFDDRAFIWSASRCILLLEASHFFPLFLPRSFAPR